MFRLLTRATHRRTGFSACARSVYASLYTYGDVISGIARDGFQYVRAHYKRLCTPIGNYYVVTGGRNTNACVGYKHAPRSPYVFCNSVTRGRRFGDTDGRETITFCTRQLSCPVFSFEFCALTERVYRVCTVRAIKRIRKTYCLGWRRTVGAAVRISKQVRSVAEK